MDDNLVVYLGVFERQQGDGMEVPLATKPPTETVNMVPTTAPLVLPVTGLKMAKLPPILDKVELLPNIPDSPLVPEKAKVYPKGTYPTSVKKKKGPKFVPYEPYKAAVTPFIDEKFQRRSSEMSRTQSCPTGSGEDKPSTQVVGSEPRETSDVGPSGSGAEINPQLEENYRTMLDAKERELVRLRAALENSEKQLKIQIQVSFVNYTWIPLSSTR